MKAIILFCFIMLGKDARPQEKAHIVEAGKVLVDLIRNLKPSQTKAPNCMRLGLADCCFKNNTSGRMKVTIQLKADTSVKPVIVVILPGSEECVLEIKAGIYTYKFENTEPGTPVILRAGDIKLDACEAALVVVKPE